MGWTNPGQLYSIAAKNATNSNEINGDLDATVPSDAGTYVLRDFVSTGDALRIKLPFVPVSQYPEYIWVENHQGRNANGNLFDHFQYEGNSCVYDAVPGLYMYVQIDREHRTDTILASNLYGGYEEFARPLSANGAFDVEWASVPPGTCVGVPDTSAFQRVAPNSLTGRSDTHQARIDKNQDGLLQGPESDWLDTEYDPNSGNSYLYNLFCFGHSKQAFTLGVGGNHKLSVATNPSSASMMSLRGYNNVIPGDPKDLRRIYLNGVSVELLAQNPNGSIKVKVRFDDVDVNNDARWCADEIQLNPVPTGNGYSLNVITGNTITLDRGTTATRRDAPQTYNGQSVFTSPTLMRCTANSWLNVGVGAGFIVDNGSTLRLESGSRMDIGYGAVLRVKRGGTLELMGGSVLNILPGGQVIIEEDVVNGQDGHLKFHPDARINMEAANSVLEIAGRLEIQANATFTTGRSADPNTTLGLVKFTNTDVPSLNIWAGANSRFILRSNNTNNRILHVEQESLRGPNTLVEFSLLKGTATLADNARIIPPVSNSTLVKFVNAVVTSSSGIRNTHRGVRLNGQAQLTLNNSTFSKGVYGIYSYNTTLGNKPVLSDCNFLDCATGMYNYDQGIKAIGCTFSSCDNGLRCLQMSQTSYLSDCKAQYNTGTGVGYQGSSTLKILSPAFDGNRTGLHLSGATALVDCGSLSRNDDTGIRVEQGATLRMDPINNTVHNPVTLLNNGTTIRCVQANNIYVDLGYNTLKPLTTGTQNALNGTFLCQPYAATQPANRNNWNGMAYQPITTADYAITSCGGTLQFVDPYGAAAVMCNDVNHLQGPEGQGESMSMMSAFCADCADVWGGEEAPSDLASASLSAMELGANDELPGNELEAIDAFHALLAEPVPDPGEQEKFLLNYDHVVMLESYGDALEKRQLNPVMDDADLNTYLDRMTTVQDARIQAAQPGDQDDFIFYTRLERAQITRAAGRLEEAVGQLLGIPEPPLEEEQEALARILCFTRTELALTNGTYTWEEAETALLICSGEAGTRSLLATGPEQAATDSEPTLQPNPATTEVSVQGFAGADCVLRLLDITGRTVVQEVRFNGSTTIPIQSLRPGTYLCRITADNERTWTGRLVVGW